MPAVGSSRREEEEGVCGCVVAAAAGTREGTYGGA